MELYNTLSRRKETFVPREPGAVDIYVCGVTTYDQSHLGHARPAVVFDCLRRYLRLKGYRVRLVQNFTDIDDKIIARANAEGKDPLELADFYCQEYLQNITRLGVERADIYPRVSAHIKEIIDMIAGLIERGAAYPAGGHVFFSVAAFPEYGKLSNQKLEELESQGSGAGDEEQYKRHPVDFALWKAAKPGEPAWDSPWGKGRPGWHIECSAMALKYLGNGFDIHGGGMDLVFPHHENEIAQSEAYTGKAPFARYFLHNGLVTVNGEKMSKSLGNFVSIDEALARYPAELWRYFILSSHYRSVLDFEEERLEAAHKAWTRLNRAVWDLEEAGVQPDWPGLAAVWAGMETAQNNQGTELESAVYAAARRLDEALANDFNTPAAMAVLFELLPAIKVDGRPQRGLAPALGFLKEVLSDLLGVLAPAKPGGVNDALAEGLLRLLVELRAEARKKKDWTTADRIRDGLARLGVKLEDTPEGTRWTIS
ncbi:MAG TPA: cysteine--tRNA ligase [Firmicutes bacterium]|nr:cysteine--tRNA ligase [Bacillota bacterium]